MDNLLADPSFEAGDRGAWGSTQADLDWIEGDAHTGTTHLRVRSTGAGNRNVQALPPVPCLPGAVVSAGGWARWVAGTPRPMTVMCQFLNASGGQVGNVIGQPVTPAPGGWSPFVSLAAVAPTGTAAVRYQARINSAAAGDTVDLDTMALAFGDTVDPDPDPPARTLYELWTGTRLLPVVAWHVVLPGGGTAPLRMPAPR
ncbi:hypothetical protein [Nocardioides nanhaiensis]|uniref:CBM-cenC domain-containing protein n=1 Tax=Nocardioides nanhaiensis TaxID=1476871 RepID=A0ABP8W6J6_9ACTN